MLTVASKTRLLALLLLLPHLFSSLTTQEEVDTRVIYNAYESMWPIETKNKSQCPKADSKKKESMKSRMKEKYMTLWQLPYTLMDTKIAKAIKYSLDLRKITACERFNQLPMELRGRIVSKAIQEYMAPRSVPGSSFKYFSTKWVSAEWHKHTENSLRWPFNLQQLIDETKRTELERILGTELNYFWSSSDLAEDGLFWPVLHITPTIDDLELLIRILRKDIVMQPDASTIHYRVIIKLSSTNHHIITQEFTSEYMQSAQQELVSLVRHIEVAELDLWDDQSLPAIMVNLLSLRIDRERHYDYHPGIVSPITTHIQQIIYDTGNKFPWPPQLQLGACSHYVLKSNSWSARHWVKGFLGCGSYFRIYADPPTITRLKRNTQTIFEFAFPDTPMLLDDEAVATITAQLKEYRFVIQESGFRDMYDIVRIHVSEVKNEVLVCDEEGNPLSGSPVMTSHSFQLIVSPVYTLD